ncbi:N-6 DNA methylase, partial [Streptomyces hundungensis]|uniref:HsdM family class I SAM-dependent methyltransferase n=1 Tax=Streptomyces hundungensis TaxID=1077946 RepID=UPI0033E495FA
MPDQAAEVTAAAIARLAGVGRAAVSNWRRRHADFPKPVGGTETSPSFALHDVQRWLREQGKVAEVPLRERIWQQLSGHPAGALTALVHAGCALLVVRERPTRWRELAALDDAELTARLSALIEEVLGERFGQAGPAPHPGAQGEGRPPGGRGVHSRSVNTPGAADLAPSVPLVRGAAELAGEVGAREAFEFLLGRHLDANPRQYTLTPRGPAELMAALAGPAATVLDPACGTGTLLCALPDAGALHAQDADPDLAALTGLRLALAGTADVCAAAADSLRADAFEHLAADAVLCHPPFNERSWGHDELAYDPRWEYGLPARTESELAWVQHALARLREGVAVAPGRPYFSAEPTAG